MMKKRPRKVHSWELWWYGLREQNCLWPHNVTSFIEKIFNGITRGKRRFELIFLRQITQGLFLTSEVIRQETQKVIVICQQNLKSRYFWRLDDNNGHPQKEFLTWKGVEISVLGVS